MKLRFHVNQTAQDTGMIGQNRAALRMDASPAIGAEENKAAWTDQPTGSFTLVLTGAEAMEELKAAAGKDLIVELTVIEP